MKFTEYALANAKVPAHVVLLRSMATTALALVTNGYAPSTAQEMAVAHAFRLDLEDDADLIEPIANEVAAFITNGL